MADNFSTIGVEAVVKGLSSFESNLNKMNDTMLGTADSVDDIAQTIADELTFQTTVLTERLFDVVDAVKEVGKKLDVTDEEMEDTSKSTKTFGERLSNTVNTLSNFASAVVNVTKFVIDLGAKLIKVAIDGVKFFADQVVKVGKFSIDAAIEFESAFAGVIKTTDGLVDETGQLTQSGAELQQQFRDLAKDVPIAVEELLGIGELGGQLGVAKEDLLEFTEAIAAMGVATNLTTDDAASQFAQIANVMGTVEREGSEAFSKLGSTIVALGNSSATTEADIANFASRIAGVGAIVGLTEADVFGISAAFSSVGIAAEAGGTAVQKVLLAMNDALLGNTNVVTNNTKAIGKGETKLKKLSDQLTIAELRQSEFTDKTKESTRVAAQIKIDNLTRQYNEQSQALDTLVNTHGQLSTAENKLTKFASVAGIEAEKFKELWEKDAAGAFDLFVKGLGAAGDDAVGILKELGLTDQRLIRSFLSLGKADNVLTDSLNLANKAWDENTALAKEAEQRYATTESQIQLAKNTLKDLGISIGQFVLPMFNDLLIIGRDFLNFISVVLTDGDTLNDFLSRLPESIQPFVKSLGDIIVWLQENLPIAIQIASDFFTNTLLPVLADVFTWLQTNIPLAIQTVSAFWTDTLLPAITAVGDWIQNTLVPIFTTIQSWLAELLPIAIDELSTLWKDVLLPALASLQEQWETNVRPALVELFVFLQDRMPGIIESVKELWENVLQPALKTVGDFIADTLIPIFGQVVTWLLETLPPAIDIAADVFENVIIPAMEAVWTFIDETLIPIFEDVQNWLDENIPVAIEAARMAWEDVLKPALETIWNFIEQNLLPIIDLLVEILEITLTLAIDTVTGAWKNTLLPILEDVWTFISENILPIFTDVWEFIKDKLEPIVISLKENAFDKLAEALERVEAIAAIVKDTLVKLRDKLKTIKIPDWAKPGSPPPFAVGLIDIAKAMNDLSTIAIPRLSTSLDVILPQNISLGATVPAMAGPSMSAQPVMQNTMNANFNTTVNGNMGQASFEARVMNVVNKAFATGVR